MARAIRSETDLPRCQASQVKGLQSRAPFPVKWFAELETRALKFGGIYNLRDDDDLDCVGP